MCGAAVEDRLRAGISRDESQLTLCFSARNGPTIVQVLQPVGSLYSSQSSEGSTRAIWQREAPHPGHSQGFAERNHADRGNVKDASVTSHYSPLDGLRQVFGT